MNVVRLDSIDEVEGTGARYCAWLQSVSFFAYLAPGWYAGQVYLSFGTDSRPEKTNPMHFGQSMSSNFSTPHQSSDFFDE